MPEKKIKVVFNSDYDGLANTKPSPMHETRPDGSPSLAQKKFLKNEEYVYDGPVTVCEPAKKGDVVSLPLETVRMLRGAGRVEFVED